ncbi:hypothetical protein AB8O64_19720 [Streptomyces sp. QH1-20]|uniref:hypothetical protein n=1 Tax=Streptomyces sp. QH1-20 TaxID=3240934 RepID=UPI0035191C88
MTVRSAWLLPIGQTREDTRLAPLGVMAPSGELSSRDGVIAGAQPFAASGISAMQVQIGIGRAIVQGTATQGAYPAAITAPETLTISDGDAQHPRIDSVALRISDPGYDASPSALARVEIVQGTPAPTPAAPPIPGAALRLWDITVPAGTSAGTGGIAWTSALADRRRYTASYGGIIPRGYGLGFTGSYDGQYRDSGTGLERWSATAATWQPLDPVIGWTPVTLAPGYSNDGNAQGPVRWRRLMIGGVPHMQWRGGVGWTAAAPPNDSYPFTGTLPAECRPVRHTSLVAAAGGTPISVDFQRGGLVRLVPLTGVRTWLSFTGLTYPLDS